MRRPCVHDAVWSSFYQPGGRADDDDNDDGATSKLVFTRFLLDKEVFLFLLY